MPAPNALIDGAQWYVPDGAVTVGSHLRIVGHLRKITSLAWDCTERRWHLTTQPIEEATRIESGTAATPKKTRRRSGSS